MLVYTLPELKWTTRVHGINWLFKERLKKIKVSIVGVNSYEKGYLTICLLML